MTIQERNRRLADGPEIFENPELLKERVMFYDDFMELPKEKQAEIYKFCRCHANNEVVRENLKQIRYAVTHIYFNDR